MGLVFFKYDNGSLFGICSYIQRLLLFARDKSI